MSSRSRQRIFLLFFFTLKKSDCRTLILGATVCSSGKRFRNPKCLLMESENRLKALNYLELHTNYIYYSLFLVL